VNKVNKCTAEWRALSLLLIVLFSIIVWPNRPIAIAYCVIACGLGFWKSAFPLYAWFIAYPLYYVFTHSLGFPAYIALAPLPVASLILIGFKENIWAKIIWPALFLVVFIGCSTISLLHMLSRSGGGDLLLSLCMAIIGLLAMLSGAAVVLSRERMGISLAQIVIVAACVATAVAVYQIEGAARLNIAGNVRKVANIVSIAVVFVMLRMFVYLGLRRNVWDYILLGGLCVALTATLSRGAMLAVGFTGFSLLAMSNLWSRRGRFGTALVAVAIIITGVLLALRYDDKITGGYAKRITDNPGQIGSNIRWEIWRKTWGRLDGIEKFIGSGPGSFSDNASAAGFDLYSHSVFADALVTTGIIGGGALIVFSGAVVLYSIRRRNIHAAVFSILAISLFITHGSVTGSLDFWVLLGMGFGYLMIMGCSGAGIANRRVGVIQSNRSSARGLM
jgi:hypothetical protein